MVQDSIFLFAPQAKVIICHLLHSCPCCSVLKFVLLCTCAGEYIPGGGVPQPEMQPQRLQIFGPGEGGSILPLL
jgi:hypothetical protein